ncbi:MAG: efflux RND transporter periplasmic adaptor subunit [Pirellula sp.]|nr:efflux RND transporter periplasmic adaptor subunit [Pirellula sp.]
MKILSIGNVTVVLIAFTGAGLGLWTRSSMSATDESVKRHSNSVSLVSTRSADDQEQLVRDIPLRQSNGQRESSVIQESVVSRENAGSVAPAELRLQPIDMLPGIAHPLQVAEISAAADGPLWKLFVVEGDAVAPDTVMGLIDNRVALASVIAAQSTADRQAMMDAAKAKVALADQFLNRIQQAASKKAASGLEVDEAGSRLAEAKAALQEGLESQRDALARLQIEKARLDTHEIRAPFQGTVIKIYPHLGETVSRGAPIVKIADVTRLRADLYVPLSRAASIRAGEATQLLAELPGQPLLNAKVVFIAPLIDAATQTIRVVVEIENPDKQLPAGFAVRLSPLGREPNML